MYTQILIIGAGVTGCAVARVLSRYEADITVVDRGADVAEGASKANSGIVHAGFDAKPGTLKARLNVEGAHMYPALCAELSVPYSQPGALVLGFTPQDRALLERLAIQGEENGVPGVRIIGREEALTLEPHANPEILCALHAPTSGLTSPYEMTFALADHAALNGVCFRLGETVTRVERREDGLWRVLTDKGEYTCKILVNCAGVGAGILHNMISTEKIHIIARRGQYYLLDRMKSLPFRHTLFQCPTKMGKGVLVSPTVHGNLLLGPSAEDIDDGLDTSTTAEGLRFVLDRCRLTWPAASIRATITNFSGVRAHEEKDDFVIGAVPGALDAYEAIGIESPGLSAAPAIGEMLGGQIAGEQALAPKAHIVPMPVRKKPFREMDDRERADAVAENPLYGSIICRCEVITEAEIREAIRRPVGATTIDGIKRRTRAGMGRCQGGFCSPRVAEILSEELHIPMTQVTKCGGKSRLLVETIQEALKEDC
ncbi:MAG TPA: NAD(P)/FAD-dependent oxidoreductase [Candidatus Ventricola intestinavium]|nr:NAD(P)/FAD-dependent oxidoreductase [Candidatus Ventricola intestinavium]